MKKKELNVKLLRKIQKHILDEPKRLDMFVIAAKKGKSDSILYDPPGGKWPSCNTTGCIAGWGLLLSGKRLTGHNDIEKASKLIGVSEKPDFDSIWGVSEADKLFFVENWPEKLERQYEDARTDKKRAKVTARRIDHFIQHGE